MKTNQVWNAECGRQNASHGVMSRRWFRTATSDRRSLTAGFTLIELLTVIAIIGVIAGMIFAIAGPAKKQQYLKTARGEMERISIALDNYKAKYGVYPPSNGQTANYYAGAGTNCMYSPLYYELSGVTNVTIGGTPCFQTLDGSAAIPVSAVQTAFGVGGFVNCSKTGDEEGGRAQNFLLGMPAKNIGTVRAGGIWISNLITSVRGPDASYVPLGSAAPEVNPFRYVYPGINNPNSYDLWIAVRINGQTNLLCNWTKQVIVNSPVP